MLLLTLRGTPNILRYERRQEEERILIALNMSHEPAQGSTHQDFRCYRHTSTVPARTRVEVHGFAHIGGLLYRLGRSGIKPKRSSQETTRFCRPF